MTIELKPIGFAFKQDILQYRESFTVYGRELTYPPMIGLYTQDQVDAMIAAAPHPPTDSPLLDKSSIKPVRGDLSNEMDSPTDAEILELAAYHHFDPVVFARALMAKGK